MNTKVGEEPDVSSSG